MATVKEPEQAPAPRFRKSIFLRVIPSLFGLLFIVVISMAAIMVYGRNTFEAAGPLKAPKTVTIKSGSSTVKISEQLEYEGIIASKLVFTGAAYLWKIRFHGSIKAGEFVIPKQASMAKILTILRDGKSVYFKVTIPEGFTTAQALARITATKNLSGEISHTPAEGVLLPDTILFHRGRSRDSVVQQMQKEQEKLLASLWSQRVKDLPLKTPQEAVILASIVERETSLANERPHIAAVFINRLNKGMRLQSDPTIIYGLVGGKGKLGRPIRRSEIKQKTPYNTYEINGLPPTPITNPGREAIKAVLNPANSDDLYFVADGTGGHAFAPTLKEHTANVRKWRQLQKAKTAPQTPLLLDNKPGR